MFAFAADTRAFCVVTANNRLRVWRSPGDAPKQFVGKDSLAVQCTSVAWARTPASGKRKMTGSDATEVGAIAMGMDDGTVSVWDVQRGVVATKLGTSEQHLAAVTDVAFSKDGKLLYSSSAEKYITEWDLATSEAKRQLKGDKGGTTKLCASAGARSLLAAGGSTLRLLDLASDSKKGKKLPSSHAADISLLSFSPNGHLLASACAGGRFVDVFSCVDGQEALLRTLTLAHEPTALVIHSVPDAMATLAAACAPNGITVFRFGAAPSDAASPVAASSLELAASRPGAGAVLAARFHESRPHATLVVATGEPLAPTVEPLAYASEAGGLSASLALGRAASGGGGGAAELAVGAGDGEQPRVVGPGELGMRSCEQDADALPTSRVKRLRDAAGGEAGDQLTIKQRLDALSAALAAPLEAKAKAAPTTESLATLLDQALQSSDDALLEECLTVVDAGVVGLSVARLAPARVVPLLLRLAAKVERRPGRGINLSVWLRAILTRHAGYLMSVPSLHVKLAGLYHILEARTAVFPKLLSLNGRLELALAHIDAHGGGGGGGGRKASAPQAVYDEEVEDVLAAAGDDDE